MEWMHLLGVMGKICITNLKINYKHYTIVFVKMKSDFKAKMYKYFFMILALDCQPSYTQFPTSLLDRPEL